VNAPAPPPLIDSRRAWLVAIASFVVLTVAGGSHYVAVVALKPIAADFGWPRAVPALCYSLAMLGMGVGGIVMGRWSDRAGVALPVACGIAMIALGAWLSSVSGGALGLLLAHGLFIGLLGNAALFAPLLANTARWFRRRRGIAVAVVASGQTLGGAFWPPVFSHLIAAHGWRRTYFLFALAVVVLAVPWTLALRRRPPAIPVAPSAPGAAAIEERSFGLAPGAALAALSVAIVGCCVAMAMPIVHLVAHATDLGHATVRAAELLAVLLGSAVVSRLLWGLVADRLGGLRTLLATSAGQALALSAFAFVEGLAGLYVVAALFGLGFGGVLPCYTLIIREHFPPAGTGWRVGTVLLFGTVGMALGGWLGAHVYDVSGRYAAAFLVGVAFNLLNLAIVAALVHRERRLTRPAADRRAARPMPGR